MTRTRLRALGAAAVAAVLASSAAIGTAAPGATFALWQDDAFIDLQARIPLTPPPSGDVQFHEGEWTQNGLGAMHFEMNFGSHAARSDAFRYLEVMIPDHLLNTTSRYTEGGHDLRRGFKVYWTPQGETPPTVDGTSPGNMSANGGILLENRESIAGSRVSFVRDFGSVNNWAGTITIVMHREGHPPRHPATNYYHMTLLGWWWLFTDGSAQAQQFPQILLDNKHPHVSWHPSDQEPPEWYGFAGFVPWAPSIAGINEDLSDYDLTFVVPVPDDAALVVDEEPELVDDGVLDVSEPDAVDEGVVDGESDADDVEDVVEAPADGVEQLLPAEPKPAPAPEADPQPAPTPEPGPAPEPAPEPVTEEPATEEPAGEEPALEEQEPELEPAVDEYEAFAALPAVLDVDSEATEYAREPDESAAYGLKPESEPEPAADPADDGSDEPEVFYDEHGRRVDADGYLVDEGGNRIEPAPEEYAGAEDDGA